MIVFLCISGISLGLISFTICWCPRPKRAAKSCRALSEAALQGQGRSSGVSLENHKKYVWKTIEKPLKNIGLGSMVLEYWPTNWPLSSNFPKNPSISRCQYSSTMDPYWGMFECLQSYTLYELPVISVSLYKRWWYLVEATQKESRYR